MSAPESKPGLGNQVKQGQTQQDQQQQQQQEQRRGQPQDGGSQRGGTMNSPGDANESGSAGSTRRDDTTTPGKQR